MDLYCTKKLSSIDELCLGSIDTLPFLHIITPEVFIKIQNDNFYIADCPGDSACIPNLIKLKKLLAKQHSKETKLMDDIIWIKPSPCMLYKKGENTLSYNKILLNTPVKLQLSIKNTYIQDIPKPYNLSNMFWSIDYIIVDDNFAFESTA